jgi:aspartyl-tRNA(Asn)/glutamyl-tRNA(Gln) amidotransferase subunit B
MRSVEEAREYATTLHSLLRYIGVSSCDMEKGAIRFEANVSIRQLGTVVFNTRTEIKNLNSFKAMEKAIEYEMQRQIAVVEGGGEVRQETVGWNDLTGATFSQRGKEEAHDYRYFPEPDLPPLAVDDDWLDQIRSSMPELPRQKQERLKRQYNLTEYDARVLVAQVQLADFFEEVMAVSPSIPAKSVVNWITGSILAWMNNRGSENIQIPLNPEQLAGLVIATTAGTINLNTAKAVLDEMLVSGKSADEIIREKGLTQIDDRSMLRQMIRDSLAEYPQELASYLAGKDTLANWFLGQVMRKTKGQAAPQLVQTILAEVLKSIKDDSQSSD